jgi:hypothetical protein
LRRLKLFVIPLFLLLTACAPRGDPSSRAVESYLNALVEKDGDRISAVSCGDWEASALVELDSFQAVEAELEGLSCAKTGTDGDAALVSCQGKIIATYGKESQELDLSVRTYRVVEQGGDWLVCGVQ